MCMVRILRRFSFTLEKLETTYQLGLTMVPEGGLFVKVNEVKDDEDVR